MKKGQDARPHTFGLSLLFVVMLVLCLMTFAAISVAEARNDLTGAEKKLDKLKAYNAAEDAAELAIADYTAGAELDPDSAPEKLDFAVAVDENDELRVTAVLRHDEETGHIWYAVTRWQIAQTASWNANTTIDVLPDGRIGW